MTIITSFNAKLAYLFLCLVALLSVPQELDAQDNDYSQFWSAPLLLNPALSGMSYGANVSLNYRDRWPSFKEAYVNYTISYDQYIAPLNGGIGLLIDVDNSGGGLYRTFAAYGNYAYQVSTQDMSIKFGLGVGYLQKSIDESRLLYLDQIDPIFGSTGISTDEPSLLNNKISRVDFNAGGLIFTDKSYLGFSTRHLNSPNFGFTEAEKVELPIHISIHGGHVFELTGMKSKYESYFSPNMMYTRQFGFDQLLVGGHLSIGPVFGGFYGRHTFSNFDALIGLIGVRYKILEFGFSYDIAMGSSKSFSANAKEVSLTLDFDESKKLSQKRQRRRSGSCPAIFK